MKKPVIIAPSDVWFRGPTIVPIPREIILFRVTETII